MRESLSTKKALIIDPDYAKAHYNLAVAYYLNKQYELAIEHCDKAVDLGFEIHPKFLQHLTVYR
jgi:tetratricopeptide (TPR) repeat protein